MAGRPSFKKRDKERARQERAKEKAVKREQRKNDRVPRTLGPNGEDPDLAGIVPGPQPTPTESS